MARREELERAAKAGDAESQYQLAQLIEADGGARGEGERWSDWCKRAAEQGHIGAMFALGTSLLDGDGIEADVPEGLAWLEKGSAAGDEHAAYSLGLLHFFGDRVEQNVERGLEYARLAAERGHARAQVLVATEILEEGGGGRLDEVERWLSRAAEQPCEDERQRGVLIDALERLESALRSAGKDASAVAPLLAKVRATHAPAEGGDDAADAAAVFEASAERFVRQAIETETVYFLEDADGMRATGLSHDGEHDLMLVFGDAGEARAVLEATGEALAGHAVESEHLFELLGATLPELEEEDIRVVPNCLPDLAGVEVEPRVLRTRLLSRLTAEQAARFEELARQATADE